MKKRDPNRPACRPGCDGSSHPDCRGHNGKRQDCGKNPIAGGRVCPSHGGSAAQVKAKANERHRDELARTAVVTYGLRRDIGHHEALLEEIQWTSGHIEWLRLQIAALGAQDLIEGLRGTKHQVGQSVEGPVDVTTTDSGPGVHEWVKLYLEERSHLVRVCSAAAKAGVQERQVRMAEEMARQHSQLVLGLIDDIGLVGEARTEALEAASRRFQVFAGGLGAGAG